MEIIQEPFCGKIQKCRLCQTVVKIEKEDLYLWNNASIKYNCPVCHLRNNVKYTSDKTEESVGTVREIKQLLVKEELKKEEEKKLRREEELKRKKEEENDNLVGALLLGFSAVIFFTFIILMIVMP
jgi:nitrate/TMAO reductase-like tetraheme cytochrome c subunit